jgi:hypothetical protein
VLKVVDSKSEKGFRSIALSPTLAEELWQLRRSSAYDGDAEYVFAHPTLGNPLNLDWYKREHERRSRRRVSRSGSRVDLQGRVGPAPRRSTRLRRGAARRDHPRRGGRFERTRRDDEGGHSSMSTTKRYLHLSGVVFREEADRLEERLLGRSSTDLSESEDTSADSAEVEKPEAALSD